MTRDLPGVALAITFFMTLFTVYRTRQKGLQIDSGPMCLLVFVCWHREVIELKGWSRRRTTRSYSAQLLTAADRCKNLITNINVSFEKYSIFKYSWFFCFECPSRFWLQLRGEGTYQKKLDVKTFLSSSSNRETQRCNGRKSRLGKLLLLV